MWNVFRDSLRDVRDRVRTGVRLGLQSGMLRSLSRAGLFELLRVLASGSQSPSVIYRINARNSPEGPALIWRGRTTRWGELDARIDGLAAGLVQRGFGPKTSLILMMRNRQEFVETGAACARIGAAAVSISWRSTAQELVYLAAHSGAMGIVTESELLPAIEDAEAELPSPFLENVLVTDAAASAVGDDEHDGVHGRRPLRVTRLETLYEAAPPKGGFDVGNANDAAVIVYTSGTTGKPKGAVRKFPKATMQAAFGFINETPMRVDDVHLVAAPLYHSTGFGFMSMSAMLGQTIVLMDEFKPELFLELVDRYRVTTTAVVPTMLHRILELPRDVRRKYDARTLRAVFSGGAPLPASLAAEFMDAFGDVLFNFYGSTETGLVTLGKPAELRAAPGTIGKALPGNEIRLLDDAGRVVPPFAVGELYVRNKLLVAGYHNDPAATAASMREGFFSVGDLARCDAAGNYFIEGRKRDMVISGGVNVYPAEVEAVLEAHPEVAEVAVVGVPDREWGERVCAFVVKRPGTNLDGAALKAFARQRLAGPKAPRDYVFIEALPRNPTGKVLKRELRRVGAEPS